MAITRATLRNAILAFDRGPSVRRFDKDGHLFVDSCVLSAANVCEYYGREIPNGEKLGYEPNRLYSLYRDPESLKRAASTLNGKPILIDHQAISADNHPHEQVVGSVGSDVSFVGTRLKGSLSFWAPEAIDAVKSGRMRSVSAGYRFRVIPERGSIGGVAYDGRQIVESFNHLALVSAPRVAEAVIGDSMPKFRKLARDGVIVGGRPDPEPGRIIQKPRPITFKDTKMAEDDRPSVQLVNLLRDRARELADDTVTEGSTMSFLQQIDAFLGSKEDGEQPEVGGDTRAHRGNSAAGIYDRFPDLRKIKVSG